MTPEAWLRFCCEQLGKEWTDLPAIRQISRNHALYGAYVESTVREFIKRFVSPLRISTGTILYEDNIGEMPPQLDAVIWHPSPLPPILESGEFAIIPRTSAVAYLEIKSSNYHRKVGQRIAKHLGLVDDLVPKVGLPPAIEEDQRALGVICVHSPGVVDAQLDQMISEKRVAVMVRRQKRSSKVTVDSSGITRLAVFLTHVRRRANLLDGVFAIRDADELATTLKGLIARP